MGKQNKIISPAMSLDGYTIWNWFKGNWKTVRELIKVGLPAVIGWSLTANPELTGLITITGKYLLDLGEYYFKEKRG